MKKLFVILITIALLCLSATMVYGTGGARADAMGGAFTAVANDGYAPYWNPAGMTQLKVLAITGGLGTWMSTDGNTTFMSLDAGITTQSLAGNIYLNGLSTYDPSTGYWEDISASTLVLSAATNVFSKFLAIGGNFNLIGESISVSDQFQTYGSVSGGAMSYDFGVLIKPADMMSIGVVGFNLNEPQITLSDDYGNPYQTYTIPSSISAGIALKPSKSTTVAADFEVSGDNQILRVGLEQTALWDGIAVRVGMHQNLNVPDSMVITAGGGIKIFGFYTDIALLGLQSEIEMPTVEISGGFRW